MKKYRIITPYGTVYEIDGDGCFLKYGEHTWEHPHDSWKCTGIAELLPFGNIRRISLDTFKAMMEAGKSFLFKNGTPKYTVLDLDHGTSGLWGNTKYHGIKYAYPV
jgi:hypothetical protein